MQITLDEARTFYPESSADFQPTPQKAVSNRVRHGFNDLRLQKRHDLLIEQLRSTQKGSIYASSNTRGEQEAFYRFVNNKKVELAELIHLNTRFTVPAQGDGSREPLLILQDTTEINLALGSSALRKEWVSTVGCTSNDKTPGLSVLASLVVGADSQRLYGMSELILYGRKQRKISKQRRGKERSLRNRSMDLENKESGAWLMGARSTTAQLGLDMKRRSCVVMDREADNYELLRRLSQQCGGAAFLVRCKNDRKVRLIGQHGEGAIEKSTAVLARCASSKLRSFKLRKQDFYSKTSGKRIKRAARKAKLSVQFCRVKVEVPKGNGYRTKKPQALLPPVTLIKVSEHGRGKRQNRIEWTLMTTLPVANEEEAWRIVGYYRSRWHIEQFFRTMKAGFGIEKSQLQRFEAIKKMIVMVAKASEAAMKLTHAFKQEDASPAEQLFNAEQMNVLQQLGKGYAKKETGKTGSNPFAEGSMAYAAWVIARLGKWKGDPSSGLPGPTTMVKGLNRFADLMNLLDILEKP